MHEEAVEECGRVVEREAARGIGQETRQEAARRGGDTAIAEPAQMRRHRGRDLGRQMEREPRRLAFGALDLGRAVEEELHLAVAGHDGDAVSLQNAEIRRIAQVIALPGIAVDDERVDPRLRHRLGDTTAPFLPQHEHLLHEPPGS